MKETRKKDRALHHNDKPATSIAADHYQEALRQIRNDQNHDAILNLRRCLDLDPGFTDARLRLGGIYQNEGQIEESEKQLGQILIENPYHTEALVRHGANLVLSGNTVDAKKCFEKANALNPNNPYIATCMAQLYIRKGKTAKALEIISPLLAGAFVHETTAIVFADICRQANRSEEAIDLLEEVTERPELPRNSRSDALFALGKLYEDSQDYQKAFQCYSDANSLKRPEVNITELITYTDTIIATWNLHFQSQLAHATFRFGMQKPIFIIGMPRSGTTLVERILASHPKVFGAGELKYIPEIVQNLPEKLGTGTNYPDCLKRADKAWLDMVAGEYLNKLASISGGRFEMVCDKLPGNFWNLGIIKLLFPNSVIIHCKRNMLDTCLSNYFTNFSDGNPYSFDLKNTGVYYRQYEKVMEHWQNDLQLPMLDIQYEELVNDNELLSRKLVEYCGLKWDKNCLYPHDNPGDIVTASYNQAREKIHTTAIGRWKHYDIFLDPLREALDDYNSMQN